MTHSCCERMKVLLILWTALLPVVKVLSESSEPPPPLYPQVVLAEYGINYNKSLNSSLEWVFLYSNKNNSQGARIYVDSEASEDEPLLVVVRQKKGILSWQIPLLVERKNAEPLAFSKTSRTLCSANYYKVGRSYLENEEFITVSISIESQSKIEFNLLVVAETDFYIRPGESRDLVVSPSEPRYYGYNFSNQAENSSVLVKINSTSDTCMTVSIQNPSCPVFDLERNIEFSGYWQTVSQLGGITIPRDAYPNGFFIVLVVKGEDTDCTLEMGSSDRSKSVTISITPNITYKDGVKAATIALAIGLAFCISYVIGVLSHKVRIRRKLQQEAVLDVDVPDPEMLPSPSALEDPGPSQWTSVDDGDSSLDEDDIDILQDALSDKEIIRTRRVLSVSDLARKEPKILRHKSRLYLYYLGTIAVFYALPVVQLMATYQRVIHVTGNQDLCYFNFLCSHPFFGFSDFNHVFSNFGYVLLGLLFIWLTWTREQGDLAFAEKKKSFGIPQHYGLFYAMGTALMMEGVLSACYHVCPNHSNFQFDTSFMYIIAVLCMVKIYQTRHPDINARASVTFGVLALIIFLGMLGVLDGSYYFWIIFTIIHLVVCLVLTAQIYYMGRWRLDRGMFRRIINTFKHDARSGITNIMRPMYGGRLILLVIANFCNVALAVLGNTHRGKDFATFLLTILMSNLLLYTFFYIVMKLCHGERIKNPTVCYIILSFITWGFALYFFIEKSISWALTPAQSRHSNRPCESLLNFFDYHDIWHFLSALAMFFSFMVLLTLDDDLEDTHRSLIPVF
ncbi:SID1 transmembrane family member 1-like [Fopius arisanus]|uniref:SID1 transmembrane family member 1-like n=1 Tax=Fopius arisanus TaxID=64838 RepID=A0A9R1U2R0_9HYME|nr:PREDICTED: SID1 transmembrane family member 1-like [Fopius arisanus]